MPNYGNTSYGGGPYAGNLPVANSPASELNNNQFPVLIVEMGFGTGALAEPATWTDVTHWTPSFSVNRGRQHELNRFEAGTATILLDNRDGRFAPYNTASPYYPNVIPYVQVRMRAIWAGVTYPIFRGYIESWPVKWLSASDSQVTVSAVDMTKTLNLKKVANLSTYPTVIAADSPVRWYRLDDPVGATVAADSSGNNATAALVANATAAATDIAAQFGTAPAIVASNGTAFDCGTKLGMLNMGSSLSTGANFTVEAWVKVRVAGGTIFNAQGPVNFWRLSTLDGSDSTTVRGAVQLNMYNGTLFSTVNGLIPIDDGNWHHVVGVHDQTGNALRVYIDGIQDQSSTNANSVATLPTPMGFGGTGNVFGVGGTPNHNGALDEAAIYNSALSATRVAAHYVAGAWPLQGQTSGARFTSFLTAAGIPAARQVVDAGLSTVQPATNSALTSSVLANGQALSDTEGGPLFIDAAGRVVFHDRQFTSKSPNGIAGVVLGDSGTIGPGGESPYLVDSADLQRDDLDTWNVAAVTPAGQGPQIYSDATSIGTYTERTLTISSLTVSNVEAMGQAQWNVNKYKTPADRLRAISFTPMSDPSVLFPAALGFELLTRVRVKRRPKDGSGITFDQQSLLEGISHEVGKGTWKTTWRLSPTDAAPLMWIIDDPVAGKIVDGASQLPPVAIGW